MVGFFRLILLFFFAVLLPEMATANVRQLDDCKRPVISVDTWFGKKWSFNADLVSTAFGIFSAASFDAYMDDGPLFLPTDKLGRIGWQRLHWNSGNYRFNGRLTGLQFDTYYKAARNCTFVIVAVRGTDGPSIRDGFSNAYPVTRFLPLIPNQYSEIRRQFAKVRKFAEAKFGRGKITYVATGHSLGGGLAIQLAKCFDRVSAVVFDASPVEGDSACPADRTTVVEIYDKDEILSRLRAFMGKSRLLHVNTANLATYGINPYELKGRKPITQHGIGGMTLALLRAPLDCMTSKGAACEVRDAFESQPYAYQHILLCDVYAKHARRIKEFEKVCTAPRPGTL